MADAGRIKTKWKNSKIGLEFRIRYVCDEIAGQYELALATVSVPCELSRLEPFIYWLQHNGEQDSFTTPWIYRLGPYPYPISAQLWSKILRISFFPNGQNPWLMGSRPLSKIANINAPINITLSIVSQTKSGFCTL